MRAVGAPLSDIELAAFLRCVRSFINVPFGHQGRKPWRLDCAGLLLVSMQGKARNRPYPDDPIGSFRQEWEGRPTVDLEAYGRDPFREGLEGALVANLGPPVDEPGKAGDVVLMRFGGDPRHVGVLSNHPEGGLRLIHTDSALRRVTEHRADTGWAEFIFAVYRP